MAPGDAAKLVRRMQKKVDPHTHVITVVCPPFVSLPAVAMAAETDKFKVGAQNLHESDEGTYTGEVSGPMLQGLASYVIVGHSERRRYFHENDKQIALKLAAAIRNNLTPVLCIGDNLADREHGHAKRVVVDQLHGCLSQLTAEDMRKIVITYEPVWAISTGDGHGHFARPEDVTPMVKIIRETVEELFGEAASGDLKILYGGSANADNCEAYLNLENIDGLLVGGASINPEEFPKIIAKAQSMAK